MKITESMLIEHNACSEQVAKFSALWPNGCVVTLATSRQALAAGLDLNWAAWNLLSFSARDAYSAAIAEPRRAYSAALADADRAYSAATAEPRRAYDAARAPAFVAACRVHDQETK
jgi:hypothetical protein